MKQSALIGAILIAIFTSQAQALDLAREADKANQASEDLLESLSRKHPDHKKQLKPNVNDGFQVVLMPVRK